MVSHDWPHGIEQYGDVKDLVRRKPFFRQEISENAFGSPPAAHLLHTLQPLYWFAAHLHVKFHARVIHRNNIGSAESAGWQLSADVAEGKGLIPSQVLNARIRSSSDNAKDSLEALTKELKDPSLVSVLDEMKDGTTALPSAAAAPLTTQFLSPESLPCPNTMPDLTEQMTQFLSLDKCLPRKKYLAILHVPVHYPSDSDACNDSKLEYDLEWLAILRKTHHLAASSHPHRVQLPQMIRSNGRTIYPHQVTDADIAWVKERIGEDLTIPENFVPTLPEKYDEQNPPAAQPPPLPRMGNPQTDTLLELLQLEHLPNLTIPYCREQGQQASFSSTPSQEPVRSQNLSFADRDEIDLDEDIESSFNTEIVYSKDVDRDEDEIDVDDEVSSNVLQIDESLVQNDMKKPRLDEGR
jgi:lariat debranching enzyme